MASPRVRVWFVVTSKREKSGAWVPRASMVEGVKTIVRGVRYILLIKDPSYHRGWSFSPLLEFF
jgi:hypothetical protein